MSIENPSVSIYEEDSFYRITMWILRKRSTFEKLNMNQPDAFIDSPFYLLTSNYIRNILYIYILFSYDYANYFDEDYRIHQKSYWLYTETMHALSDTQPWKQNMNVLSACVWRVESIMKRGQYFTIISEQIISEMFLTNYSIHGNIFPWYWVYYAWIDRTFLSKVSNGCVQRLLEQHMLRDCTRLLLKFIHRWCHPLTCSLITYFCLDSLQELALPAARRLQSLRIIE